MLKIFVGSSTIAKRQARLLIDGCQHPNLQFIPWWDEFHAGRTLLQELTRIKNEVQAAVLIMSPEAVATNAKGNQVTIPNLNVLFEFGFFYNALGHDKVAIAKYGTVNLPSDLSGYIHINGSNFFQPNNGVPVGKKTKKEFDRWLDALITGGTP